MSTIESLVPSALPSSLSGAPLVDSDDDADDGDELSESASQRADYQRKRQVFVAIHTRRHPEIVAFLRQRKVRAAHADNHAEPDSTRTNRRTTNTLNSAKNHAPTPHSPATPASATKPTRQTASGRKRRGADLDPNHQPIAVDDDSDPEENSIPRPRPSTPDAIKPILLQSARKKPKTAFEAFFTRPAMETYIKSTNTTRDTTNK